MFCMNYKVTKTRNVSKILTTCHSFVELSGHKQEVLETETDNKRTTQLGFKWQFVTT